MAEPRHVQKARPNKEPVVALGDTTKEKKAELTAEPAAPSKSEEQTKKNETKQKQKKKKK